jgi:hypothetical protein
MAYLDFILFSKEGDMIGKPEWFQRRKYGGWGLHPKDWRGWVYILAFAIPIIVFQAIPIWNLEFRLVITGIWALILIIDTIDLFIKLKKDEREKIMRPLLKETQCGQSVLYLLSGSLFRWQFPQFDNKCLLITGLLQRWSRV